MDSRTFFTRLGLISAGVSALLGLLYLLLPAAQEHGWFALASVLLFVTICTGLFFAGASSARSSNKYAFNNLISLSVFGKMAVALGFLFVYREIAHPQNQWFVFIFLFCYVVYTVYEVWFMMLLAKNK